MTNDQIITNEINLQMFIANIVKQNPVVLFMKGSKQQPLCVFSNTIVQILLKEKVDFLDIDVFSIPNLREEIKKFVNWPTIPQLYSNGHFIGGADIVSSLHQKNQLLQTLQK